MASLRETFSWVGPTVSSPHLLSHQFGVSFSVHEYWCTDSISPSSGPPLLSHHSFESEFAWFIKEPRLKMKVIVR